MKQPFFINILRFSIIFSLPEIAFAYVGPGAGLSAIGTVLALIGAVLLGIIGFIWYPVKRLLRGKPAEGIEDLDDAPDADESSLKEQDPE